jgi:decaprenyl-phosphate phosphoribosyltransferase
LFTPLIRAVRPKQWLKNLLVYAAALASGRADQSHALVEATVAFLAFTLVASATYLLNDSLDVDADRLHPTKRHRPIAAGQLGARAALTAALIMTASTFGFLLGTGRWRLAVVIGVYMVATTSYSLWLKHVTILDLVLVASGFVLRAIGGAVAIDVEVSNWFFTSTSLGSLLMVSGKRSSERIALGDSGETRSTLAVYTATFLAQVRATASGALLVTYCLMAFEKAAEVDSHVPWFELSIVPFAAGVLRYCQRLDLGDGAAPEDLVLSDTFLLASGFCWLALFTTATYLA